MKNLKILLNPLLWLGIIVLLYIPFEMLAKPDANGMSRLHCDIVIYKLRAVGIVIDILLFTIVRLAYFAVKKRFFTKLAA